MQIEQNKEMKNPDISKKWRTLSGENNWKGILNPLDMDLRQYLIYYGEMAQSTYDTFNKSKYSKYGGSSIFSKKDFFSKMGLDKEHPYKYRVTKYIYATSGIDVPEAFIIKSLSREAWSYESNFIGYIAVAEDESLALLGRREIVVAWRGSIQSLEWINNFQFFKVHAPDIFGENDDGDDDDAPRIHEGWYSIYNSEDPRSPYNKTSARKQVMLEIQNLMEQYKNDEISITITGHSMGAALGTINAADLVINNINKPKSSPNNNSCLVTAILFGSPRVGDTNFKKIFSKYDNLKLLRVSNLLDVVVIYPITGYKHVGEELKIDTTKSPYLRFPGTFWTWHNLEVYMHGIAGTQGDDNGEFNMVIKRDISLINKQWDHVKEEFLIPPRWWSLKNKGMVQQSDGSWVLKDHEDDYDDEF